MLAMSGLHRKPGPENGLIWSPDGDPATARGYSDGRTTTFSPVRAAAVAKAVLTSSIG